MSLMIGYKASVEQFGPRDLLAFSLRAEELGFDFVALSDHFQPMRHSNAHASFSLACLGALGANAERLQIGSSVITPTLRYHPAIIAQAFATLACLAPGRVFLGVGTGEAVNETPATGIRWPPGSERRERLAEAIDLIRRLWTDERVSFAGRWYRTDKATIYDRPETPIPILVAASVPVTASLAGRCGDGLITTSGKRTELYPELVGAFEAGARSAGRDPRNLTLLLEVKVSYDRDRQHAHDACKWWAALALPAADKIGLDDPVELERRSLSAGTNAQSRFLVTDDPDELIAGLASYRRLGFDRLLFHAPGHDQLRFLDQFAADVLPRLRLNEEIRPGKSYSPIGRRMAETRLSSDTRTWTGS